MAAGPRSAHLAAVYDSRTQAYVAFGNGGLLRVVTRELPPGGSVLDIGCASGGLLAALEGIAGRRVGVEISTSAAAQARTVADQVVEGDITDPAVDIPGSYDVIVAGDVIEHVLDPAAVLRRARTLLAGDGRLIVCVPNVAHWSARVALARGRWDYTDTGLMDRGHLRFYTRRSLVAELAAAGFEVQQVEVIVPQLRNHLPLLDRAPGRFAARAESAWRSLGRRRQDLLGYQLVAVARRGLEPTVTSG